MVGLLMVREASTKELCLSFVGLFVGNSFECDGNSRVSTPTQAIPTEQPPFVDDPAAVCSGVISPASDLSDLSTPLVFQMILQLCAAVLSLLPVGSVTSALLVVMVVSLMVYNKRRARLVSLINRIPGPPALPFIGNTIELNVEHDELFTRLVSGGLMYPRGDGVVRGWLGAKPWVLLYKSSVAEVELFARVTGSTTLWGIHRGVNKAWMGTTPYLMLSKPAMLEPILASNKNIEKSQDYVYLRPWLGTGLLTSSGKKWHTRRKILTPTFHFKILEDFLDVFQEQSDILVEKLKHKVGKDPFNIFHYVTLCTLDIICETAMGRSVNAQGDSDSQYVKAIYEISSIVQCRQAKMWLQPDWLFKMTSLSNKHDNCVKILHGFSNKVIRERKEEIRRQKEEKLCSSPSAEDEALIYGRKKRLAFLDLLIEASQDGAVLCNEDIREEVDTFMFEGHDTTSAAICWALYLLGSHPEIQDRVVEELNYVLGDYDRRLVMKDFQNLKYLECCIKEALRLYPSVPFIARQLKQDVKIAHYTIPAGTTALIVTYMLHRNPEYFPEPEKFNPDHFLPENCVGRHPYAYIPFSAGPRNCIGQKFALLEEKAVIAAVLRNYRVEAVDRREDLTLLGELILRPKHGLNIRLQPRRS
uniref:Cytochrome P450 n=1 Tax=Timema genevievae TaxID=629358 RepID=A0A7R9JYW1_TIMGE|nr:unnamed protein product [Timema genevievae]